MPLKRGKSKGVVSSNIREMKEAGHSQAQSVAAALNMARESGGKHPHKNLGEYLHPKKKKR
jgi:hypothetical protein